jgi:hypothetical protein
MRGDKGMRGVRDIEGLKFMTDSTWPLVVAATV